MTGTSMQKCFLDTELLLLRSNLNFVLICGLYFRDCKKKSLIQKEAKFRQLPYFIFQKCDTSKILL